MIRVRGNSMKRSDECNNPHDDVDESTIRELTMSLMRMLIDKIMKMPVGIFEDGAHTKTLRRRANAGRQDFPPKSDAKLVPV